MPYTSLKNGLLKEKGEVQSAGCAIIRGAVSEKEALEWDRITREYIATNKDKVRGVSYSSGNCLRIKMRLQT